MTQIQDTSAQDIVLEKASRKWRNLGLVGVLILAIAFTFPAVKKWHSSDASVELESLRLATVSRGTFVKDISLQSRVTAAVRPVLYSPARGVVTYHVSPGEQVKLQQLLAEIDSPELKSIYEQELAVLAQMQSDYSREKIRSKSEKLAKQKDKDKARVKLNAAKREKRRADEAKTKALISDIDFQKAKDELLNAELEYIHVEKESLLLDETLTFEIEAKGLHLSSQKHKVNELKRQVDALKILSPVEGMVGKLEAQPKENVAKHQALLNVVDLSQYELEVTIPESYADDISLGLGAEISFSAKTYKGVITAISPEIINNSVAAKVQFKDNQPSGLRQNQRLTTRILLDEKENAILLQKGAFAEANQGRTAFVIENDVAVRVPIVIGSRSLSQLEILEGLKPGQTVIISDIREFMASTQVTIIE